jgi:single-strand DNA-binding protein
MSAPNINVVALSGNLTKDPFYSNNGTAVCVLEVAVSGSRYNKETKKYEPKPNYVKVATFGKLAENCHKFLSKGRGVAVEGSQQSYDYEAKDGSKRSGTETVARIVQFLGGRSSGEPKAAVSDEPELDLSDLSLETRQALAAALSKSKKA